MAALLTRLLIKQPGTIHTGGPTEPIACRVSQLNQRQGYQAMGAMMAHRIYEPNALAPGYYVKWSRQITIRTFFDESLDTGFLTAMCVVI